MWSVDDVWSVDYVSNCRFFSGPEDRERSGYSEERGDWEGRVDEPHPVLAHEINNEEKDS